METIHITHTAIALLAAAGFMLIVQLYIHLYLYRRVKLNKRTDSRKRNYLTEQLPPISVIITASEEADALRRNLDAILTQNYPRYEVIVINDGKGNESEDFLTLMQNRYPHLYHSFVPDSSRYIDRKELAVSLGVKASKYPWIVQTDASCRPESDQWLRLLARNFTRHTAYVIGGTRLEQGEERRTRRLARHHRRTETRRLALALAGHPTTHNVQNFAWLKANTTPPCSANTRVENSDGSILITSPHTRPQWQQELHNARPRRNHNVPLCLLTVADIFSRAFLIITVVAAVIVTI